MKFARKSRLYDAEFARKSKLQQRILKPALTIAYHENKNFIIPYMHENENFNAGEFARFQEF